MSKIFRNCVEFKLCIVSVPVGKSCRVAKLIVSSKGMLVNRETMSKLAMVRDETLLILVTSITNEKVSLIVKVLVVNSLRRVTKYMAKL